MNQNIKVYVSERSKECDQLVDYLEDNNVSFLTKNVTNNKETLRELQQYNIYSTPTMVIDEKHHVIGFHKDSIDHYLMKE